MDDKQVTENYVMNIGGTLTNDGWIDTEESASDNDPNELSTSVTGSLVNKGQLSQPYSEKYGDAYEKLAKLISGLYTTKSGRSPYEGDQIALGEPRVELIDDENATQFVDNWDLIHQYPENAVTADRLKEIIANGELTYVAGYQAIKCKGNAEWYYIYLGGGNSNTQDVITDEEFAEWKTIISELDFTDGVLEANPKIGKTLFDIVNFPDGASINLKEGVAYGQLPAEWDGTLTGSFTKPM